MQQNIEVHSSKNLILKYVLFWKWTQYFNKFWKNFYIFDFPLWKFVLFLFFVIIELCESLIVSKFRRNLICFQIWFTRSIAFKITFVPKILKKWKKNWKFCKKWYYKYSPLFLKPIFKGTFSMSFSFLEKNEKKFHKYSIFEKNSWCFFTWKKD